MAAVRDGKGHRERRLFLGKSKDAQKLIKKKNSKKVHKGSVVAL